MLSYALQLGPIAGHLSKLWPAKFTTEIYNINLSRFDNVIVFLRNSFQRQNLLLIIQTQWGTRLVLLFWDIHLISLIVSKERSMIYTSQLLSFLLLFLGAWTVELFIGIFATDVHVV